MTNDSINQKERKYSLNIEDLWLAIHSQGIELKEGLSIKNGKEIDFPGVFSYIDYKKDYLVVTNTEVVMSESAFCPLSGVEEPEETINLLFHECTCPNLYFLGVALGEVLFFYCSVETLVVGLGNARKASCFEKIAFVENCVCGDFHLSGALLEELDIRANCTVGQMYIDGEASIRKFSIWDRSKIKGAYFSKSSWCDDFVIFISTIGTILIRENSHIGELLVSGQSETGDIIISDYSFCNKVWINQSSQTGKISVGNKSIIGSLEILANCKTTEIEIEDGVFESIELNQCKVNVIRCFNLFCFSFECFSVEITEILLNKCKLEVFAIHQTGSNFFIKESCLNSLFLSSVTISKDQIFLIATTKIHHLYLREFWMFGQLNLNKVYAATLLQFQVSSTYGSQENKNLEQADSLESEINTKRIDFIYSLNSLLSKDESFIKEDTQRLGKYKGIFILIGSNLGKAIISAVNFNEFKLVFRDTVMADVIAIGTQLPKANLFIAKPDENIIDQKESDNVSMTLEIKDEETEDSSKFVNTPNTNRIHEPCYNVVDEKESIDYLKQTTSFLSQLKKISENEGDVVEASWYQSKFLDYRQKLLNLQYKESPSSEIFFNRFSFKLNKLSNNHGENWFKALVFTLLIALLFFTLFFTCVNYKYPFLVNGNIVLNFIGDYFSFLDVTHKIDYVVQNKNDINGGAKVFDFLGRVFIGYGVFQFVSAFRRHGRRGN